MLLRRLTSLIVRGGECVSPLKCTKEIINLKSLYDRAGKTFPDGPPAVQGVPRRTGQQDPLRPPSVANEAANYPMMVGNRATGRGDSSGALSRRGDSTAA